MATSELSTMASGLLRPQASPAFIAPIHGSTDSNSATTGLAATSWEHPPSFYCPISQQCMHDPVVLADGHTYERRHIERWLGDHSTSPVSGLQLPPVTFFSNHALRNAIEEYFQQVFSVHRRAIRKTMESAEGFSNSALLRTVDALMQCSLLIGSDLSTESMLRQMMDEAKQLLGADVASVFLVDAATKELVSSVNSTNEVLRIPISTGIAGHVASTGEPLVIKDVYNDPRFNRAVDKKLGYRTRSMICVPLKAKKCDVIGVAQIINKVRISCIDPVTSRSSNFCPPDAGEEELSFSADDLKFLQVFATQAAAAVAASSAPKDAPPPQILAQSSEIAVKPSHKVSDAETSNAALPAATTEILRLSLQSWELDTLTLAAETGDRPLSTLGTYLFDAVGLVDHFGLDRAKLRAFLLEIERGYEATQGGAAPYHNRAHAAAVLHGMHVLVHHCSLAQVAARTFQSLEQESEESLADGSGKLESMACLLAAAVHDYEHLGLNNDFLVKTGHERAIRHNDHNVNENHHAAAAFALLRKTELNFLDVLPRKAFIRLRRLVIELVLGTDMARSGFIIESFTKNLASSSDAQVCFQPKNANEAVLLLQMGMKCADLGHLTLPWGLHCSWVRRLEAEFFAQGDKELEHGLPISFLMDRRKPGASETQLGFFDFAVLPLFRVLCRAVPGALPLLSRVQVNYVAYGGALPAESEAHAETAGVQSALEELPVVAAQENNSRSRCRRFWMCLRHQRSSPSETE
eukprot:TRINITY_DN27929_c0_g1_i1.p1 TRINITY_DN27929_c0_g1~~TRINITY_DN27929_c0_g1_i1.p1  ORF type:complete len:779 (-),score=143.68 TRINITY_DN27929_c0_g1_i1:39-2288(-)